MNVSQEKVLLDTILRMARLAEYHDPGIENHLHRIREYAFVLARGVGLSEEEAKTLSYASQLHDVGMAGIAREIVKKPDTLSHAEWETIKQHPRIGAEILRGSPSPIIQKGEVIALTHHERWDGSGYPQGLKGEDIPLGGRICGLVDVFDAVVTKRAYRSEISPQEALELIQDAIGMFFDPELVEVFSDKFGEILQIRDKYT